jgi:hypothetical protein
VSRSRKKKTDGTVVVCPSVRNEQNSPLRGKHHHLCFVGGGGLVDRGDAEVAAFCCMLDGGRVHGVA